MINTNELSEIAKRIRRNIIALTFNAGNHGSHIGGSLSMVEILATMYLKVMNVSPENYNDEMRDRFILSKGHGALGLYCVLKEAGFITEEQLFSFKKDGSEFWTHPCKNPKIGIEVSSGSLGQGLSYGAGLAFALKKKNNPAHVYVVIGDGECDEGSIWEAASFISHHNLTNLTVVIDENKLQLDAPTKDIINKDSLSLRWQAFGFETVDADGHNFESLLKAFDAKSDKPIAIMAKTIKGKGVSFIENDAQWHMHTLSEEQYKQAMEEVK